MYTQEPRALTRPLHIFDAPALTIHALAAIGEAALSAAHALDRALEHRIERECRAERPRARLGPVMRTSAHDGVPDAHKLR